MEYVTVVGLASGIASFDNAVKPVIAEGFSPVGGVCNNKANSYFVAFVKDPTLITTECRVATGASVALMTTIAKQYVAEGFTPFGPIAYNGDNTVCQLFVKQTVVS